MDENIERLHLFVKLSFNFVSVQFTFSKIMAKCKYLDKCRFYNRFKSSFDSNCRIYVAKYCLGCGEQNCKRLEYRKSNGESAIDIYTPEGGVLILLEEDNLHV